VSFFSKLDSTFTIITHTTPNNTDSESVESVVQKPDDEGPIAEYTYWHEREIGLGVLVEQLKNSKVMAVVNVLGVARSDKGAAFSEIRGDVLRSYIEARDNDKFLYTVLRYFKVRFLHYSYSILA
jgi:hypothetical protein